MLKTEEIRKMSPKDIEKKITENKKELFDLRMKQATGSLEKPAMIDHLRKDVARMKTILKEKMLSEGSDK